MDTLRHPTRIQSPQATPATSTRADPSPGYRPLPAAAPTVAERPATPAVPPAQAAAAAPAPAPAPGDRDDHDHDRSVAAEAPPQPLPGASSPPADLTKALFDAAPMMAHTPPDERPRERLQQLGAAALKNEELLALFLRSGPPGRSVLSMARELLASCNHSLVDLSRRSVPDLMKVKGIGRAKACEILAAVEFARRMSTEQVKRAPVEQPEDVYRLMAPSLHTRPRESLFVILVNTRLRVTGIHEISKGTVNETVAHPRDIFQPVILNDSYGFLLVHNHPSGDPAPSQADRSLTRRVAAAADTMQVRFLDHIIIGHPSPQHEPWFSFRESGLL